MNVAFGMHNLLPLLAMPNAFVWDMTALPLMTMCNHMLELTVKLCVVELLKYKQGCPTKDRLLSAKDGRMSVWHADQMA